jgi:hypothetical protein
MAAKCGGKNELIAIAVRYVRQFQSPSNVWPIAMAKWKGAETFDALKYLDNLLHITSFVTWAEEQVSVGVLFSRSCFCFLTETNGQVVEIGTRRLPVAMPVAADWMSLIPVMNNCALPNATPSPSTGTNSVICGLCGFTALDKVSSWKSMIDKFWLRSAATDVRWAGVEHLFAATPEKVVWEPLHCHTRCLDTFLKFLIGNLAAAQTRQLATILHPAHENYSATASLTINSVSFLRLLFPLCPPHLFVTRRNSSTLLDSPDGCKIGPQTSEKSMCQAQSATLHFESWHCRSSPLSSTSGHSSTRRTRQRKRP